MPAIGADGAKPKKDETEATPGKPQVKIRRHRTLGRTGFKVSDVSMGGLYDDGNVVRYAYDCGINYFDTAEGYMNGDSERRIGEAMPHMDRKKIFITTKLEMKDDETEQTILERYGRCLKRLKTDYADALYMHSVNEVKLVGHEGFHAAIGKLKTDGRVKHAGISCHGPRSEEQDSMEKVLVTAAEDGRFDLMLLSYNFLNKAEAERVLAACKKHGVGTTAMKTSPARLDLEPFDPENPTGEYKEYIDGAVAQGREREEVIKRVADWVAEQEQNLKKSAPFIEKHGVTTAEELRAAAVKWVLANDDMHTVCLRMQTFEDIERMVPLSGTSLDRADLGLLRDWERFHGTEYCRHGCTDCAAACPERVPVSTIMRYAYYFGTQGREKYAMGKYASLDEPRALACLSCDGPCRQACPHNVNVPAQLMKAHALMSLV
jgi:predicted aldo/keto reductase-like oxidoreductase